MDLEPGIPGPALITLPNTHCISTPPSASRPSDLAKLLGPLGATGVSPIKQETHRLPSLELVLDQLTLRFLLCTASKEGPPLLVRREPSGQTDFPSNIMEKKFKSNKQYSPWNIPISILPKVKATSKDKLVL